MPRQRFRCRNTFSTRYRSSAESPSAFPLLPPFPQFHSCRTPIGQQALRVNSFDQLACLCAIRAGALCNKYADQHTMRIHGQMVLAVAPPSVRPCIFPLQAKADRFHPFDRPGSPGASRSCRQQFPLPPSGRGQRQGRIRAEGWRWIESPSAGPWQSRRPRGLAPAFRVAEPLRGLPRRFAPRNDEGGRCNKVAGASCSRPHHGGAGCSPHFLPAVQTPVFPVFPA
jgi:hypothetical protein